MKKLLLFCLLTLAYTARGQVAIITDTGTITQKNSDGTVTTKSFTRRITMDSTTIVKDSTGRRYTYNEWHDKMLSGSYRLQKKGTPDDGLNEYTLAKMSDADLARIRAMRASMPVDETGVIRTGARFNFVKAKTIDGYEVVPDKLAGKVVVMNFWYVACVPCRTEIPELNKLVETYANNPNVVFIGVARDDKDKIEEFLKTMPFQYHHIADGKKLAEIYQVKGYPTNVIVGKDSNIKKHSTGYSLGGLDDFKKIIDEQLAAK